MSAASRARRSSIKASSSRHQIPAFFPDLIDPEVVSALAMVHQRFSTNTFPSWDRAHPYRFLAHNGEINTLRGNINWMHAREKLFASPLFGEDIKKLLPIIEPNGSDSAMFDNCLELLVRTGRSLRARRDDDDSRGVAERPADESATSARSTSFIPA